MQLNDEFRIFFAWRISIAPEGHNGIPLGMLSHPLTPEAKVNEINMQKCIKSYALCNPQKSRRHYAIHRRRLEGGGNSR